MIYDAKLYCDISEISYKIQDLADELKSLGLGFESRHDELYAIAEGIQYARDEIHFFDVDITDEEMEAEWKKREKA